MEGAAGKLEKKAEKKEKEWAIALGLSLEEFGSNGEDEFNWVDLASQRADVALFSCMVEA